MKPQGTFKPEAIEQLYAAYAEKHGETWEYAAQAQNFSEAFDYTTCERPDGSKYGTLGQCRKGKEVSPEELGVKMPKSPGAGPMPESAIAEAHKKAKGYGGSWGDAEESLFQSVYAKAQDTKHLGAIHRAVVKADDNGDIAAKPGAFMAMKKAMAEQLQLNQRSGVGAKREKEIAAMTPEQKKRMLREEAIKRGIAGGVVNPRMR